MSRPKGSRNAEFEQKRHALLEKLRRRLAQADGHTASFRALAEAAEVTYPTLRHYFSDREGILSAFYAWSRNEGENYLRQMRAADLPFAASIREAVFSIVGAFSVPDFQALHNVGLREGILNSRPGQDYLQQILEPTLQAIEARLAAHMGRGEMRSADPRHAAIMLVSPLLVGSLHQASLGGAEVRHMRMEDLAESVIASFLNAHAAEPN